MPFNNLVLPGGGIETVSSNISTLNVTTSATIGGNLNFNAATATLSVDPTNAASFINGPGTVTFNGATSGAIVAGGNINTTSSLNVVSNSGALALTSNFGAVGSSSLAVNVSAGASGSRQLSLTLDGAKSSFVNDSDVDVSPTRPALLLGATTGTQDINIFSSGGIGINGAVNAATFINLEPQTRVLQTSSAGLLSSPTVFLDAGMDSGQPGVPLQLATGQLTAAANSGSAFLNNNQTILLLNSGAFGEFSLSNSGNLTISQTNPFGNGFGIIAAKIDLAVDVVTTINARTIVGAEYLRSFANYIQFSSLSGNGPVNVVNNGLIFALSTIGFNGGTSNAVNLTGSGGVQVFFNTVNFGNLDPVTLAPIGAVTLLNGPLNTINLGSVSAAQSMGIFGNGSPGDIIVTAVATPPVTPTIPIIPTRPATPTLALLGVPFGFGTSGPQTATSLTSTPASTGLNPSSSSLFTLDEETASQSTVLSNTATDITQIFNYTNLDQSAVQAQRYFQTGGDNFIHASKSFGYVFDSAEVARLKNENVQIVEDTNANFINVNKGNVLFAPQSDVVVGTKEGKIFIAGGAAALVMVTGNDVVIYDLHQKSAKQVRVLVGKKGIDLSPGRFVVLTRKDVNDFGKLDSVFHQIGYRDPQSHDLGDGVKAFCGDFSIPSAMTTIVPLKKMLTSSDKQDRNTVNKILRTSVMLSGLMANGAPFQNGDPAR